MFPTATIRNFSIKLITIFILFSLTTAAQVSNVITDVKIGNAKEGENLLITVQLLQGVNASKVLYIYRTFGETEYKEVEMAVRGNTADLELPGEKVSLPYLECYFVVNTSTTQEAYPAGAPLQASPLQITVEAKSPKDKEIVFLAPEKNANVAQSEFFISISLLRATDKVDKAATKLFVDNVDITDKALFAEDLISFYADNFPQKFSDGNHAIRVELYDTDKKLYHTALSSFVLMSNEKAEAAENQFTYDGSVTAETRNEQISHTNEWYNNIGADLHGTYKNWDFDSRIYLTSEEKSNLQPNNRFSLNVHSDYLQLSIGDHNPVYPSLVLYGKRVRGISGALTFGAFNVQTTIGEVNRAIDAGQIIRTYHYNDPITPGDNPIDVDSSKFGAPKAVVSQLGTYSRQLFAIRPYFGKGENFQFGISYLHAKDDVSSINFGIKPQEDVVFGTDLTIGILQQRIMFNAQAAISVYNTDIAKGEITDSELYSYLDSSSAKSVLDIKPLISKFITVNQYLKPINPEKLSTFAAEGGLTINLFDNYFKGGYIYRGNDYQSFGNQYIRTNVAGFNILDRVRLMDNKLFISGTYEDLQDNLQKTTVATTTFKTATGSVSYFPRTNLPNIIVSYSKNINENDLADTLLSKIQNHTDRMMAQVSYDVFYYYKHMLSINASTSTKDDESISDNDASNKSISLSANTYWDEVFSTNLNLMYNQSNIKYASFDTLKTKHVTETTLNYFTFTLGARHLFLNNKLLVNASINPSFGDFQRISIDANASYALLTNFSMQLQFRYIMNKKIPGGILDEYNDSIIGLSARFNL